MTGRSIDGRGLAKRVEARVKERVAAVTRRNGRPPRLDVILVGADPASEIYVGRKEDACRRVGIDAQLHRLTESASAQDVAHLLDQLNWDPQTAGILLQLPLPPALDALALLESIQPDKDVDCFHPQNLGRAVQGTAALWPATPRAVMAVLDDEKIPLKGAHAVIVNHSNLIGRPLAALLLQRDATVTVCHKHTRDLAAETSRADVLITATGVAGLITQAHVKPGAVVIDVGISREGDKVRGDVRFDEVLQKAAAVTPVPGGIGPMTVAMLLENVVAAAELQRPGGRA